MIPRIASIFATALLCASLTGCWFSGPESSDVVIKTTFGHILDDRGWAVGSEFNLYVEAERAWGGGTLSIEQNGDAPVFEQHEQLGGRSLINPFAQNNQVGGTVVAAGRFDVVYRNAQGEEIARIPQTASEPESYSLGLLLDDCPEFPDLVMGTETSVLEGANLFVAPAPLDADGNQLIGHFNFTLTMTTDGSDDILDELAIYHYIVVDGDSTVTATIDGVDHVFTIRAVSEDEVSGLQIAGMPEKHGVEDHFLLTALGLDEGGAAIHGILADWGGGFASQTTAAADGADVEACFGEICTDWSGPQ